jgi:hypothetical protein
MFEMEYSIVCEQMQKRKLRMQVTVMINIVSVSHSIAAHQINGILHKQYLSINHLFGHGNISHTCQLHFEFKSFEIRRFGAA